MFSGCGGFDLGFRGGFTSLGKYYQRLPFNVIWANDFEKNACRTYRYNLGKIRCADVWRVLNTLPDSCDVLMGGFPCTDITPQGHGLGIGKGTKSSLFRAMVEGVRRTKPKIFIVENVKALVLDHHYLTLRIILREFRELGYRVEYKLLHAADYGVPQTRQRVFIVGTHSKFVFPKEKLLWVGVGDAIRDLEGIDENVTFSHIWSRAEISPTWNSSKYCSKEDRPGYTIDGSPSKAQFHYKLSRRLSLREVARLQTFPDDFLFKGAISPIGKMIGNAVPPVLAWWVGCSVADYLTGGLWRKIEWN